MATGTGRSTDAIYARTGEQIREIRKRRDLTQTRLAAAVGLSRTSIVMIEQGKQKMLLHTLFDLAAALDVEPAELMPKRQGLKLAEIADRIIPSHHGDEAKEFVRAVITSAESYRSDADE